MFRIDFAPDVMRQMEQVILHQLEYGGRTGAGQFMRAFEECIAALENDPRKDAAHMNGIPKRYWVKNVSEKLTLIYQIDEDASRVKVDSLIEDPNVME